MRDIKVKLENGILNLSVNLEHSIAGEKPSLGDAGELTAPDVSSFSEVLKQVSVLPPLRSVRRLVVQEAVRRADGNQSLAANLLGVTRQAISKHLKNSDD